MTAITTAVRLLREAATELKKSHTLNDDWGNEHDALTAYNAHIAAAADLERIAPQCLAQIEEPAGAAPAAVAPQDFEAWAKAEGLICEHFGIRGENSMLPLIRKAWEAGRQQPTAVAGSAPAGWRLVPAVPTREWIGAVADDGYWDCDCAQLIANILSHAPAAPALEAPAAPVSTYVEVRECSSCGHVGINDTDGSKAACNTCDWQGDSPREDKCPGCNHVGTMTSACPECGARTSLIAETHLLAAAPQAPAAPSIPQWIDDPHDIKQGQILNPAWTRAQATGAVPVAEIMSKGYNGQVLWKGKVPPVGTLLYAAPQVAPAAPIPPAGCGINPLSSRGCERGTRGCVVEHQAPAAPALSGAVIRAVDKWFSQNTGLGGCSDKDAAELAAIFAPAAPAVDASDTALLDAMERHRIAVVPEHEGQWDAELYEDGEEPLHIGSGATPREALRAAIAAQAKEGGAA